MRKNIKDLGIYYVYRWNEKQISSLYPADINLPKRYQKVVEVLDKCNFPLFIRCIRDDGENRISFLNKFSIEIASPYFEDASYFINAEIHTTKKKENEKVSKVLKIFSEKKEEILTGREYDIYISGLNLFPSFEFFETEASPSLVKAYLNKTLACKQILIENYDIFNAITQFVKLKGEKIGLEVKITPMSYPTHIHFLPRGFLSTEYKILLVLFSIYLDKSRVKDIRGIWKRQIKELEKRILK